MECECLQYGESAEREAIRSFFTSDCRSLTKARHEHVMGQGPARNPTHFIYNRNQTCYVTVKR